MNKLSALARHPNIPTDRYINTRDNQFYYLFIDCGYVVNSTLRSPGYPSNYPNNMDCVYRIRVPRGMALNIYFKYFYLEYHRNCR